MEASRFEGIAKFLRVAGFGVAIAAAHWTPGRAASLEVAPDFSLPRPTSGPPLRRADFAGQIVVLDFFAYWCVPCERASRELEAGVQQFYAGRGGNLRGIPVRVLSINLERDHPELTAEFLRRTGASLVANDFESKLLQQFGQAGIPFIAIVDGTAATEDQPEFRTVYRHAGFEGVARLRGIIDGLGPTRDTNSAAGTGASPAVSVADRNRRGARAEGAPVGRSAHVDSEVAWAFDLFLTDTKVGYREERSRMEWGVSYSFLSFTEDYRPYRSLDFFGYNETLHEDQQAAQGDLRLEVHERLTLLGGAGVYLGYPNYRRVWIANRYRQKYDHPGFPRVSGYEEPDPKGANASLGARWEYWATQGFAELKLGYARDQTAPGYEDGQDAYGNYQLIQGRERLDTVRVGFSSENVLTGRLRMLNEFAFIQVTDRELRFSYKGSINVALGERWVLRGTGGVTTESPQFDAWHAGATLEYEITPSILLSLAGRYYEDTGEIENSLPITSAAPPLRSWEAGIGLRIVGRRASFKLYVGPFRTDYDPQPGIGEEFTYLNADRHWGLAQATVSVSF